MTHSSLAIANEFLKRAQAEGKELTQMHVQKLVYIAHGWNLATNNEPLIDEQFQAWDYGPVAPGLYQALKRYGAGPVTRLIRKGDDTPWPTDDGDEPVSAQLLPSELRSIDQVWAEFKDFAAFQLSALTHQGRSPWVQAHRLQRSGPISNNSIQQYFSELSDP